MARNDSSNRTLVIVAIVGLCVLCGFGGVAGTIGWFYVRSSAELEEARVAADQMREEQEARKRAWLDSLPVDERAAIALFERAERGAKDVVTSILAGTPAGLDSEIEVSLRERAASTGGAGELTSPRAETTDGPDGRAIAVTVDVTIPWADGSVTTVRVTLGNDETEAMTASTIEIVDAPE